MEPNTFTKQKIEEALNSLDGITKAEMPPFFYTRLQARLEARASAPKAFWLWVTRPAVSMVTMLLLVILNIAAINNYVTNHKQTASPVVGGLQDFAQEYNLTGPASIYTDKITK